MRTECSSAESDSSSLTSTSHSSTLRRIRLGEKKTKLRWMGNHSFPAVPQSKLQGKCQYLGPSSQKHEGNCLPLIRALLAYYVKDRVRDRQTDRPKKDTGQVEQPLLRALSRYPADGQRAPLPSEVWPWQDAHSKSHSRGQPCT